MGGVQAVMVQYHLLIGPLRGIARGIDTATERDRWDETYIQELAPLLFAVSSR